ncbi:type I DNA topoisomerase [Candidatus Peregrinibacteria bacterium CG_4_10_14_0_2_um_filter_43_11]|nr:MAG: type I DNA topoisomerase [Candidatus Peregrinibacteria bacterium CG_4_10_14_0_2_um_filter_43_11]
MNHLIIVESPAKAKTLKNFLGAKYDIKASMGHIRDLPKKKLSIDIENNYEPEYEISPDKKKIVSELKTIFRKHKDTMVWLASDEDREGESIAWHLVKALDLKKDQYKRIAFHEITKPAVLKALENPRDIYIPLVHAQQARRILDRLVGYKLSPLLWKKVRPGLSAGRVQSVAVRIIVEREKEIEAFKPEEYWEIKTDLKAKEGEFIADLEKIKGKKAVISNKKQADNILEDLQDAKYTVANIEKKKSKSQPPPPFITSTLQQEASRKLGFSVKQTMMIAQQLYEGVKHGKDHTGLITYMRTDSFNLSEEFLKAVPKTIEKLYGKKYVLTKPRGFTKKTRGAQEAHEAIRPTHIDKTPQFLKEHLEPQQYRLYKLIWERAIATQMPDAEFDVTKVTIETNNDYGLNARGKILTQPGFMKAYVESHDDPEEELSNKDKLLPQIDEGEECALIKINPEQKFTQPPARYTEASLVKKLESEGIGRPSTYAPTISTIINRGYVEKREDKKLYPMDIGRVVNDFLMEHFHDIIDYQFTANMEEKLDDIAEGIIKWQPVIDEFYVPFEKQVEESTKNAEKAVGERILGKDPKSGRRIAVRIGRYGPMAQIGTAEEEEKPRFAKLMPDQNLQTITLKEALELFKLPRDLGEFEGAAISANVGRFGPYVRYGNTFVSIPKESDPHTIKLDEAIKLVQEKKKKDEEKIIHAFYQSKIFVLNGQYGPYIKADKRNVKIPKDKDAHKLTLEECEEIIKNAPLTSRRFTGKKK